MNITVTCSRGRSSRTYSNTKKKTGNNTGNIKDFCNDALGGYNSPCEQETPLDRYYTLNLASLVKLGTVEFRSHPATYDTEQVLHWIIFHVAFVDSFQDNLWGKPGSAVKTKKPSTQEFWQKTPDAALEQLASLQKAASLAELIDELDNKKYEKTIKYLNDRKWASPKNLGCSV